MKVKVVVIGVICALSVAAGLVYAQMDLTSIQGTATASLVDEINSDPTNGTRKFDLAISPMGGMPALQGRLTVNAAGNIAGVDLGDIQWKLNGTAITGTVFDSTGHQIATFDGSVSDEVGSGSFRTADGERGTWAWEGGTPADQDPESEDAIPEVAAPRSVGRPNTVDAGAARQQLAARLARMASRHDELAQRAEEARVTKPQANSTETVLDRLRSVSADLAPIPPDAPGGELDLEREELGR